MRGHRAIFSVAIAVAVLASSAPTGALAAVKAGGPDVASATGFPVPVASGDGTVRIPARPDRILSLSASATQMLYALGAGSQVVGVDKYSTYPPNAPRTKFTGYETSAEDYLYLRPDLVIFAFKTGSVIQQLQLLHIPALLLPPATGFAGVYSQLAELGKATGHLAAAAAVRSSLEADVKAEVNTADHGGDGDSYYVEVDPTFYTATSGTFIGAEFSLFGMHNIADAAGHGIAYPQISAEYIVKENPDYVFLADTVCCQQDATTFARRPGFAELQAVRLHHVVGVNDSVVSQWGPHTIETFVGFLARTLKP
jgi:iron complex transport system substrate-binding protein